MPEILTESFCERCGTRYTFESTAPKGKRIGRFKTLSKGLKNFVMSDDIALDEALASARSEDERETVAQQLDAFHKTFNFCMSCRQYTCSNCWNEPEGRCLTCAPHLGHEILPAPFPQLEGNGAHGYSLAGTLEEAPRIEASAWPMADLRSEAEPEAEPAPALEDVLADQPVEAEPVVEAEPEVTAAPDIAAEEITADEIRAEEIAAEPEIAVEKITADEVSAEPEVAAEPAVAAEADIAAQPAVAAEAEVAAETEDVLAVEAVAEAEPAIAAEAEPVATSEPTLDREAELVAEAAPAEPEVTEPALAEPAAQVEPEVAEPAVQPIPFPTIKPRSAVARPPAASVDDRAAAAAAQTAALLARFRPGQSIDAALDAYEASIADEPTAAESQPVVIEPPTPAIPEAVAAVEVGPEPAPEPVALEPEPIAAPEPEPVVAVEPEPEPIAAAPEPEPEPVAAAPEPEPVAAAPEPVAPARPADDRVEVPTWQIVAPEPTPVNGHPSAQPTIPAAASAEPEWPSQPQWPARPNEESAAATYLAARLAKSPTDAVLWAASSREVVAPAGVAASPGVQSCVSCGLSLSATARFCRRCGTAQQH